MSTEVPEILLSHYLKTLKLPTFVNGRRSFPDCGRIKFPISAAGLGR